MFCPRCATPNTDGVKFCRSCGGDMESVALAMRGQSAEPAQSSDRGGRPQTAQGWMERHAEGVSGAASGAVLMSVSLLIGLALALFLPATFDAPWILIWTVFFGWMAVWGGIELAAGLSKLLEAKSRLRLLDQQAKADVRALRPTTGAETLLTATSAAGLAPATTAASASVTEETTRQLDDHAGR